MERKNFQEFDCSFRCWNFDLHKSVSLVSKVKRAMNSQQTRYTIGTLHWTKPREQIGRKYRLPEPCISTVLLPAQLAATFPTHGSATLFRALTS